MNSQSKTNTESKKMSQNGSTSSSDSNSNNNQTNSSESSKDSNDLRKQVSDLAATGASIAIKKAVDASLGSMAGGNNGSGGQMDNVQWRKLAVWIAISGVAIGVAKFLSSDMVDDLITEYLEEG